MNVETAADFIEASLDHFPDGHPMQIYKRDVLPVFRERALYMQDATTLMMALYPLLSNDQMRELGDRLKSPDLKGLASLMSERPESG